MTSLAEIRDDPNYVNANAKTKAAIFEKYAAEDKNYADANPSTQAAIREKFGVGFESTGGGAAVGNPNLSRGRRAGDVSAAERLNAATGGVNRGIAGLIGLPVDAAANVINLGIAGAGAASGTTPDLIQNPVGGSGQIAGLLNKVGVNTQNPNPQDTLSQMLYTGGTVAGGSMVPGARPLPTLAAAAGGAIAEQIDPRYTGLGTMLPAAAGQAINAARTAIANPATVKKNIETFKEAGTAPSVGQATENNFLQGMESLLSKFPGGQGIFRRFAEKQQASMGDTASTGVGADVAGRTIEKGVAGFMDRTKATWQRLDDALAVKVGNAQIAPSNTVTALDDLTKVTPGAEKTTGALINPKVSEIQKNIAADLKANNGVMPYEALRSLRTKVGSMLEDSLVSGIPNGELKRVYKGLSKDIEAAAESAGAGKEFARQNQFYSARMDRVESVLDKVLGNNRQPEEIFKSILPTDRDSSNKLRAVMRSLEPGEREIVTQAVANRLGRATPGKQNDMGEMFSSETFLTNWNKLSPGAKSQLFPDETMRSNMESIASASSNIRDGSKVFANPSGSAGAGAAYGVGAGAVGASIATHSVLPIVGAAALVGSANLTSRLMTNPAFVGWLAKAPKVNSDQFPSYLARLGVVYNAADDATKQDLNGYIDSLKK